MRDITTYVGSNDKVSLIFNVRGQRFRIATPLSATEKFTGTDVPHTVPGWKAKSTALRSMYNDCGEYIYNNKDKPIAAVKSALKEIITGIPQRSGKTLVAMIRKFGETKLTEGTRRSYEDTARVVENYDAKVLPGAVTPEWLRNFERHELDRGRKPNGLSINMRNIRSTINWLLAEGVISNYPFRQFHIRHEQTRKRNLSVENLRKVAAHGGRYADMFMLMVYLLGISIKDVYHLAPDCIRDGRLEYRRYKTGRLFSIKVEPEAMELISRYKGEQHLLCFADTCKDYTVFLHHFNKELKKIVPGCSSYWSRHTWASIAASLDIPIETISAALGHSVGASVTNIYVAYDSKKVDEANRKVIDHIKGCKKK